VAGATWASRASRPRPLVNRANDPHKQRVCGMEVASKAGMTSTPPPSRAAYTVHARIHGNRWWATFSDTERSVPTPFSALMLPERVREQLQARNPEALVIVSE